MNNKEINREAIRLSRTIETQKAEKLFRYNATHYPCGLTINNLAWFLYLEYAEYDKKKLISMFKEAHSLCPNIKSLLATAQVYYDLNRFYRAEKILNRILENHYNASALSLLMVTKLYLRKYNEAKKLCKKIIRQKEFFDVESDFWIQTNLALCDCEIECGKAKRALKRLNYLLKTIGFEKMGFAPFCLIYKAGRPDIVAKTLKKHPEFFALWGAREDELFIIINSYSKTFDNIDASEFDLLIKTKYDELSFSYIYSLAKQKNNHMNYRFVMQPPKCNSYICDSI